MVIKNIKGLVQVRDNTLDWVSGAEMKSLPSIDNSYLHIEGDKIISFGPMCDCPATNDETIDATGR